MWPALPVACSPCPIAAPVSRCVSLRWSADRGDHHLFCDRSGADAGQSPGSRRLPAGARCARHAYPSDGWVGDVPGHCRRRLSCLPASGTHPGFVYSTGMPAVLVAGAVIMGIGLIDDRWGLDALTKFAGQITAASVLVTMGVAWSVLYIPVGGVGTIVLDQASSILLTLALTVSIVNAMNFVDGLDGLAAGLGLITALAICMFSVGLLRDHGGDVLYYPPAVISVVLAGACLGFLPHNFHRAKIFMGDSGSMLIGLMLAAASTTAAGPISQNAYGARDVFALLSPFLLVVAVMFVPMLDLLLAIVRRTRAGRSAFSPDKMHLHHRLLQIGHSHRRVVLIIYLWVGIVAFGAASSIFFNPRDTAAVMLGAIVVAGVATLIPLLRRGDDYYDPDLTSLEPRTTTRSSSGVHLVVRCG